MNAEQIRRIRMALGHIAGALSAIRHPALDETKAPWDARLAAMELALIDARDTMPDPDTLKPE